ncbi:potassium channel AKT1-like [Abrus precatorius]|uniref:Potassium channel n=1 Tax=Abrus precatorius TaxID=3816 RepID=A0A8B8L5B1_ABRPR|nr:potassium channel AKT1-like [Abrus precatorius]
MGWPAIRLCSALSGVGEGQHIRTYKRKLSIFFLDHSNTLFFCVREELYSVFLRKRRAQHAIHRHSGSWVERMDGKVLSIVGVYVGWIVPVIITFHEERYPWLKWTNGFVGGFLYLDVMIKFNTAYMDKNTRLLVFHRRMVVLTYLKSWFFFDFISASAAVTSASVPVFSRLKVESFPPQEDIILRNEMPETFFILVDGDVVGLEIVITQANGTKTTVTETIAPGYICGDIGVLLNRLQPFTIRTTVTTTLLKVKSKRFLKFIQSYLEDAENLSARETIKESILDMDGKLTCGKMDLPLSLCCAASMGYDSLLEQLLKWGWDKDKLDERGDTALNAAASKGNMNCVSTLLTHGADPNLRDAHGNVPLWGALMGGHALVQELLSSAGANLQNGDLGQYKENASGNRNLLIAIAAEISRRHSYDNSNLADQ